MAPTASITSSSEMACMHRHTNLSPRCRLTRLSGLTDVWLERSSRRARSTISKNLGAMREVGVSEKGAPMATYETRLRGWIRRF